MLKCLIVDDEPMAQEVLATYIEKMPFLHVVQTCSNAIEAFEALHKHTIDLIFLDINMPVISGLNFLSSLKDPPAIIFTTAYSEYAVEGFELDAVDYLLKPVNFLRFSKAIEKAVLRLEQKKDFLTDWKTILGTISENQIDVITEKEYFFVRVDNRLVKVNFSDILYIEGMKDYLKMHLMGEAPLIILQTMKSMEDQLPTQRFLRIHKSYIIALPAILAIEGNLVHIGKTQLPVGGTYRQALLAIISSEK